MPPKLTISYGLFLVGFISFVQWSEAHSIRDLCEYYLTRSGSIRIKPYTETQKRPLLSKFDLRLRNAIQTSTRPAYYHVDVEIEETCREEPRFFPLLIKPNLFEFKKMTKSAHICLLGFGDRTRGIPINDHVFLLAESQDELFFMAGLPGVKEIKPIGEDFAYFKDAQYQEKMVPEAKAYFESLGDRKGTIKVGFYWDTLKGTELGVRLQANKKVHLLSFKHQGNKGWGSARISGYAEDLIRVVEWPDIHKAMIPIPGTTKFR